MNISVLIPYKSDQGGQRDLNLSYIVNRYKKLIPEAEVVIGNDTHELFNKARAVNQAAKMATGDLFIISDSDVFFGTKLIDKIKAIASLHPWIVPFERCYRLTQEGSREVTKIGEIQLPKRINFSDIETILDCRGALMNVVSRPAFEKIGGMDERFFGWGEEDRSFAIALDTLVGKHFRMKETIFHLWHPWAEFYHPYRMKNLQLYERYTNAEGDVVAMKELVEERRK